MPELPEVRTVVKSLKQNIVGKEIKKILVFLPKLLKNVSFKKFVNLLQNKKITNIYNVGKFIVFKFTENIFLVSHLRMEGKYHTDEWNSKHDYITFIFKDNSKLFYNDTRQFGTFHIFLEDPQKHQPLLKLSNEPNQTDLEWLWHKLQNKKIAIKTALLDQTLLVGLGNIYVNEVLFETKIHPLKPTFQITKKQLKSILETSHKIMDKATKLGGSSISSYTSLNMKTGSYQNFLKVHTKANLPCLVCKNKISKIKVNGRGTYYCSFCQK